MRGQKQIEGQIFFDFCLNDDYMVVQRNDLVAGRQALKLNSAKVIRAVIMQIKAEDSELKPYKITIPELAKLLKVPTSNLYRDVEEIVDDIIRHPIQFKQVVGDKIRWVKISWTSICEYQSDFGLQITLNPVLKPYLFNLIKQGDYTQYALSQILAMKSVYAIRLFEVLTGRATHQRRSSGALVDGTSVKITVQELREYCDCLDKYPAFGNFKDKVIDTAIKEIERVASYQIAYRYIKSGRKVTAIVFDVKVNNGKQSREAREQERNRRAKEK